MSTSPPLSSPSPPQIPITITYPSTPSTSSLVMLYLNAIRTSFFKPALIKDNEIQVPIIANISGWHKIDSETLKGFCEVVKPATDGSESVSESVNNFVPAGFFQCVTFPLTLAIMCDTNFKVNCIGGLHYKNEIIVNKHVVISQDGDSDTNDDDDDDVFTTSKTSFKSSSTLEQSYITDEESGDQLFTFVAEVYGTNNVSDESEGTLVYTNISTMRFLNPTRKYHIKKHAANKPPPPPTPTKNFLPYDAKLKYPIDLGRRYSRLNGDVNPIHMSPMSAKFFGYKSCIAHGMLSVNYALTLYEKKYGVKVGRVSETQFMRPLLLPTSEVQVFFEREGGKEDRTGFEVRSKEGKVIAKGVIE